MLQRALALSRTACRSYSSKPSKTSKAKEILAAGFKKMEEDKEFRKSPDHMNEMRAAARELGVPAAYFDQVYSSVLPGSKARPVQNLSPAEQAAIDELNVQMFDTPSAQDFGRPFQYDDLPSAGHLQLEEHRDHRMYARAAAYELPQLVDVASEYKRPDSTTHNLKFKHFTFLGEDHPAEKKVVLTFDVESTGLKGNELHKLKLLAGPRFYPEKNEIKIACDQFSEQAQNKRWLGQLYSRLINAAKDNAAAFKDVPLDTRIAEKRAAKARKRAIYPDHKFPEEWNRPDLAPKQKEDLISVLARSA